MPHLFWGIAATPHIFYLQLYKAKPVAVNLATGFFLPDFNFEFTAALGTAYVTDSLYTFNPELCFAVLALNIFVSFAVTDFVLLTDKKVLHRR